MERRHNPMSDAVEALLRELISEVRGLRADHRGKKSLLTRKDRALLERLLPAIALLFQQELFTAREVREHQAPGLKFMLEGVDTKSLGRLLTRADGAAIAGNAVHCTGQESNVMLYQLRKISLP